MTVEQVKPRVIAFEVTRRCRFNCLHCRAQAGKVDDELTIGQCRKILAGVADFCVPAKTHSKHKGDFAPIVILTGGEPMERSDIYDLIQYTRELHLRPVMATCGYLMDEESIARLKDAGIAALSISLDGSQAETHDKFRRSPGAFDAAIRAAGLAHNADLRFQINTTLCKTNIGEVRGIIELAKRLGAYCFNAFILVPTGRAEKLADEVLDPIRYEVLLNELLRLKLESTIEVRVTCGPQFTRICEQAKTKRLINPSHGCMGGRGFAFISYRGDVQTCGFLDISAGNLIENGFNFKKIWTGSKFLSEIRDLSAYKGTCSECEYLSMCGGCRARAYALSGDYLAGDPICNYQSRRDKT
jgi:radical SAM protein with 4Fe4S-binding SPASM domain